MVLNGRNYNIKTKGGNAMVHEKKTIYTLNIDRAYPKEMTDMTYPLLKNYAYKIGAEFFEITERKFPEWSITYEKCQVYELGQQHGNIWNIFIDCDAIIHPDMPDLTAFINRNTVMHYGYDISMLRYRNNRFFLRDGRMIGSATWLCVASDWCIDLYRPMTDMTPDETYSQVFPLVNELRAKITPDRLVEDYVFSYNIAKYGLKFKTFKEIRQEIGIDKKPLVNHIYAVPMEEKIIQQRNVLKGWGLI